jgi:hypothetical protein
VAVTARSSPNIINAKANSATASTSGAVATGLRSARAGVGLGI